MIINKVVLDNFGVYVGQQVFDLSPKSPDQPIIVVGALNGGGKTTLLTAIQLVLYGRLAPITKASKGAYEKFLSSKINRKSSFEAGASIQISFTMDEDEGEAKYVIKRSWRPNKSGVITENFQVFLNGASSGFLTKNWADHMEGILPSRIMPLFLFDGEKIEDLADETKSSKVLASAVNGLLGIDLIEQLSADLDVYEQRKRKAIASNGEVAAIDHVQNKITDLTERIRVHKQERASMQARLERSIMKYDEVQRAYIAQGGKLYEKKSEIQRDFTDKKIEFLEHSSVMKTLASDIAPMLLVRDLIEEVAIQADTEAVSKNAESVLEILELHDKKTISELRRIGDSENRLGSLEGFLERERFKFAKKASCDRYIKISPSGHKKIHHLISGGVLSLVKNEVAQVSAVHDDICEQLTQLEKMLLAIPEDEHIAQISEKLNVSEKIVSEIRFNITKSEGAITELSREMKLAKRELKSLFSASISSLIDNEDTARILVHSEKVRRTLEVFKNKLMASKLHELEIKILECFTHLNRKSDLITSLKIDPVTFRLRLNGEDLKDLNAEDLSAGERQILAISILWGLSIASHRKIPTIIDTPLGRLDSEHRKALGLRYFPQASHQVILLSTDEEVDDGYLKMLGGAVSRTYSIKYNSDLGGSEIHDSYLF